MKKYTPEYFIAKFEAIPEEKWCMGKYRHAGRSCALGHCGARPFSPWSEEAQALYQLVKDGTGNSVTSINDSYHYYSDLGDTPKERVINALVYSAAGLGKEVV